MNLLHTIQQILPSWNSQSSLSISLCLKILAKSFFEWFGHAKILFSLMDPTMAILLVVRSALCFTPALKTLSTGTYSLKVFVVTIITPSSELACSMVVSSFLFCVLCVSDNSLRLRYWSFNFSFFLLFSVSTNSKKMLAFRTKLWSCTYIKSYCLTDRLRITERCALETSPSWFPTCAPYELQH